MDLSGQGCFVTHLIVLPELKDLLLTSLCHSTSELLWSRYLNRSQHKGDLHNIILEVYVISSKSSKEEEGSLL